MFLTHSDYDSDTGHVRAWSYTSARYDQETLQSMRRGMVQEAHTKKLRTNFACRQASPRKILIEMPVTSTTDSAQLREHKRDWCPMRERRPFIFEGRYWDNNSKTMHTLVSSNLSQSIEGR